MLKTKKGLIAIALTMSLMFVGAFAAQYYTWTVSYTVNPLTQNITINVPDTSGATVGSVPSYSHMYTLVKATDRLVALQSSTDYGWDWDVTGLTEHSASGSATNIYGVTALGLIDAYELTGSTAYSDAAKLVADMMKGYGTDYEGFHAAGLGQSWDMKFLMRYATISGDTSYSDFATRYWTWITDPTTTPRHELYEYGKQEDFYQFYITYGVSPGYAIWDCADFGLAAHAMEDPTWAGQMAVVVHNHLPDITDADDCRFIGWGPALEFLNAVNPTMYVTDIASLKSTLITEQNTDGSWGDQCPVQDTAYVIMGLAAVGEDAAQRGASWLVINQETNGGWKDTDGTEYSEVDSEAVQALASVQAGRTTPDAGVAVNKKADLHFMVTEADATALEADYYRLCVTVSLKDDDGKVVGSTQLIIVEDGSSQGKVDEAILGMDTGSYDAFVEVEYWTGAIDTGTGSVSFKINVYAVEV